MCKPDFLLPVSYPLGVVFLVVLMCEAVAATHFGAPKIGHWLEKPEYLSDVRVEMQAEGSFFDLTATGLARVKGEFESVDVMTNNAGNLSLRAYAYHTIQMLHADLPSGERVFFRKGQDTLIFEDLESAALVDVRGRRWTVRALEQIPNKKVPQT